MKDFLKSPEDIEHREKNIKNMKFAFWVFVVILSAAAIAAFIASQNTF